jgi:hypothetical protein
MADSIESALASLAKNYGKTNAVIKDLTKSMKEFSSARKQAFSVADPKAIQSVKNMTKAMETLISATDELLSAQKTLKQERSGSKKDEEAQIKRINEAAAAYEKSQKVITQTAKSIDALREKKKRDAEQWEADALKYFRTHTLLGKSFGLLSSGVGAFAAKLTFTGLAWKALNRHMQAAEIQQNILIQNYRDLSKSTTTWGDKFKDAASNIPVVGESIGEYGKKTIEANAKVVGFTEATYNMSDALRMTEATAQRMGVSTEYVGEAFTKFSRIAGTDSPKVLKTLSEGAITVSRSLGITVPEAIDFVSTRMDKFGGSAAGAIASLNNMREEAKRINDAFGRTVIRGDDVARTIQDISKQTTIYSIDQRFVGNILRENIARLQSTGKSYEQAAKQASTFAEAVTGKAPEWMKVFAGQDIMKSVMSNFKNKELTEQFGAELEAAKPGLKKEIEKILNDPTMAQYDKMMLVQEKLSGTTVGIDAMNKQILKLAKHPHGMVLIAKQFGVTLAEAEGMVDQAKMMEQRTTILNKLTAKGVELKGAEYKLGDKTYTLTEDQANALKAIDASNADALEKEKQKREFINAIIDTKNEEITLEQEKARLANQEMLNKKQLAAIENKIKLRLEDRARLQEKLNKAKAEGNPKAIADLEKEIAISDKLIKQAQLEKSRFESKVAEQEGATEGLKTVEEINRALLDEFKGYSLNSGNELKAIVTELSSTKNLLIAAGLMGLGKMLFTYTGLWGRIENHLSKLVAASGADSGGGEAKGRKVSRRKEKFQKSKRGGGSRGGRLKGLKSKLGGLGSKIKSSLGRPEGGYGANFGKDLGIAKVAGAIGAVAGLSSAMDMLTAKYDENGNKIDESAKVMGVSLTKAANNVSTFGMGMSALPGKLGKLGGQLGTLGAAFEAGTVIGQGLNTVLDKVGWSAEELGQKWADLAMKDTGWKGKLLRAIGPEQVETVKSGEAVNKKMIESMKRKGLTDKEANDVVSRSEKEKKSISDILAQMGKISGAPKKTSALTGAAMPAAMGADLNKAAATTAAATAATTAAATAATTATATSDTSSSGGLTGSFMGGPSADGSIMLKVENFMNVFAKAGAMIKQKTNRPSA